jgi:hypothetical protein
VPENWSFAVAAGDRLYVVAWDDGGPQMLLGNFTWAESQLIVTDTASWEYFVPAGPAEGFSSSGAPPIAVDDLSNLIASVNLSAGWSAPQAAADNDANNPTWGAIGGVHPDAQFDVARRALRHQQFRRQVRGLPQRRDTRPDPRARNLGNAAGRTGTCPRHGAWRKSALLTAAITGKSNHPNPEERTHHEKAQARASRTKPASPP